MTKEKILKNLSVSKDELAKKNVDELIEQLKVSRKVAQNILKVLN